jgi:hypothetical protein
MSAVNYDLMLQEMLHQDRRQGEPNRLMVASARMAQPARRRRGLKPDIYTNHVKLTHVIRKVILRQIAITNYVNPL